MSDTPSNQDSPTQDSAVTYFGKLLFVVVYRFLLMAAGFYVGHLAFLVHWSAALVLGPIVLLGLMKFWSPLDVLD